MLACHPFKYYFFLLKGYFSYLWNLCTTCQIQLVKHFRIFTKCSKVEIKSKFDLVFFSKSTKEMQIFT